MPMKNPAHPGLLIRHTCLDPLAMSISEGATALGIARPTFSNLVNGKAGVSPDMAIRLEKAFGSTADAWLRMQAAYDLAQARQHESKINVKRVTKQLPLGRALHI